MRNWNLPEREGYVIVDDPETGALYYITQAEWDMRQEMFQKMLVRFNQPPVKGIGKLFSTPADPNLGGEDFKKFWNEK